MFPKNSVRGTERQGGQLSSPRTVLYCILKFESLIRLIPVLQAEQDASPCVAAGRDRLDVTADAHRLFPLGRLGRRVGVPTVPVEMGAWAAEISDSEAVQPSNST